MADLRPHAQAELYPCAVAFARRVPPNSMIVASGGYCFEQAGKPTAYNASYMFYWMDRKGFNVCHEEQSLGTLRSLSARGAHYFVAERKALAVAPLGEFEAELRRRFRLVDSCDQALLFDLTMPPSVD